MAAVIAITPLRESSSATNPMRLILVSRSFLAETEPLRKMRAHDVAVEDFDLRVALAKTLFENLGNRRFPGAGKAREPECETFMSHFEMFLLVTIQATR